MKGSHRSSSGGEEKEKEKEMREDMSLQGGVSTMVAMKLERAATWVCSGLAAAFFSSLDICACVKVQTEDTYETVRRKYGRSDHQDEEEEEE
eukprot:c15401_g1_i2 orf=97-372(+)